MFWDMVFANESRFRHLDRTEGVRLPRGMILLAAPAFSERGRASSTGNVRALTPVSAAFVASLLLPLLTSNPVSGLNFDLSRCHWL